MVRSSWRRLKERILGDPLPPVRVAAGWALGMFVGCFIPFGLQLLVSVPLAVRWRVSRIGATVGTLVTNPVTIFFIYPAQCWVGSRMLGLPLDWAYLSAEVFPQLKSISLFVPSSWGLLTRLGFAVLGSFFAGGFLLAAVLTPITYFGVLSLLRVSKRKLLALLLVLFSPSLFAGVSGPRDFGRLEDGRRVHLWRMTGEGGLVMDFLDYGARLVRAYAPDKYGNLADVALGWNTLAEYEKFGCYMGPVVGRVGNRIADGRFTLDGVTYNLPVNETDHGRHCTLHGGTVGWDVAVWKARVFSEGRTQAIEFSHISPDGDMGFPGEVRIKVTYRVTPENVWILDYEATADKPTVLNPTHHSYWNLAGEASGDVLKQEIQIFADEYTQSTHGLIPTRNVPVAGTGFDFRALRAVDSWSDRMAADRTLTGTDFWYDHNFVLRGVNGTLHPAFKMRDPGSGRTLEIWTTEPCLQIYGSKGFTDELPSKTAGKRLCPYAALAVETQHAPDSPNRPDFPSVVLRPGETFRSRTEYRFGH